MRGILRAGLAVCMLTCVPAWAEGGWLADPASQCAVFDTGGGDRVAWTGDCEDGLATGLGTATFYRGDKEVESFTADFLHGMVVDGHVITRWGNGWSYDGDSSHGRFNGGGVLINDRQDQYLGVWTDGKLNGFGLLDRADGSRYAGEWKNDLPNGEGELRRADGSLAAGVFVDGRLAQNVAALPPDPALKTAALPAAADKPKAAAGPFAALAGMALKAVDGSSIVFNPIEGGIEMALTAAGGTPQKTTFTFMTDRLGTVVEDSGADHIANVTGFFRLADNGVELHYADGRAETLSSTPDGGVMMAMLGPQAGCRSWYPDGHVFSEAEKKVALAEYAVRLGLAPVADVSANSQGCTTPAVTPAKTVPEAAPAPHPRTAAVTAPRAPAKVRVVKTSVRASAPPRMVAALTPVTVKDSQVHTVDDMVPAPAASTPIVKGDAGDPSLCLKVESDGLNWGFRNSCDFPVQFAYCALAEKGLAGCANGGAPGSVPAKGFGALMADHSLSENGVEHGFRWVACAGGAGEVLAHLERAEPPSGSCERAPSATASTH